MQLSWTNHAIDRWGERVGTPSPQAIDRAEFAFLTSRKAVVGDVAVRLVVDEGVVVTVITEKLNRLHQPLATIGEIVGVDKGPASL